MQDQGQGLASRLAAGTWLLPGGQAGLPRVGPRQVHQGLMVQVHTLGQGQAQGEHTGAQVRPGQDSGRQPTRLLILATPWQLLVHALEEASLLPHLHKSERQDQRHPRPQDQQHPQDRQATWTGTCPLPLSLAVWLCPHLSVSTCRGPRPPPAMAHPAPCQVHMQRQGQAVEQLGLLPQAPGLVQAWVMKRLGIR